MAKRARKPVRKPAPRSTRTAASTPQTHREKIVAAFLALLGDKPFAAIGFDDVAHRSGLSLAQVQDIDDMTEEPARERLFDVLMRRLEVLAEQRNAVRSLLRSARSNPPLALALNRLAVRSQQWMLTAAGINASGPQGMIRAQGLALLFASVLRTWVDDDDPGQARTMVALDRALARGQRAVGVLNDLCSIPSRLRGLRSRRRRRSRGNSEETAAT